jgi:hypothetical protein
VIKSLSTKTAKFYQIFLKELKPVLLKLFQKTERKGTLSNSLYEVSIILIPKPDKNMTKKIIDQFP